MTHTAVELHQQGLPVKEIAAKLDLTEGRIYQIFRGEKYPLPQRNPNRGVKKLWTDAELAFLRSNLDMPVREMAVRLGRTYSSVKTKLQKLGEHTHYHCLVCDTEISQQGRYCRDHAWVERRISQSSYRAKKRGMEYTLQVERAIELLHEPCAYCGGEGGGLDRVDSSIGYTPENTVPCCNTCNVMKNDTPKGDWLAHMRKILEHQDG